MTLNYEAFDLLEQMEDWMYRRRPRLVFDKAVWRYVPAKNSVPSHPRLDSADGLRYALK